MMTMSGCPDVDVLGTFSALFLLNGEILAGLVENEGINLYMGILGMKLPSFPTKGQLEFDFWV